MGVGGAGRGNHDHSKPSTVLVLEALDETVRAGNYKTLHLEPLSYQLHFQTSSFRVCCGSLGPKH